MLLPLRVRRLPRVQLHVDLTIPATLAGAVVRASLEDSGSLSMQALSM